MEKYHWKEEAGLIDGLNALETLAERKANIYAKLLTDVNLADSMAALAIRHGKRADVLNEMTGGLKDEE